MYRPQVLFGMVATIVGISVGYLMRAHPEGLNPSRPLGMALLAPAGLSRRRKLGRVLHGARSLPQSLAMRKYALPLAPLRAPPP